MDQHVVHTELNRVVERKYWKRHLGTGIDDARVKPNNGPAGPTPGSIYSVAAIDVYKDLKKDYLDN